MLFSASTRTPTSIEEFQQRLIAAENIRVSPSLAGAKKCTESTEAVTHTLELCLSETTKAKRSAIAITWPPNTVLCEFKSFGKIRYT